MSLFRDHFLAIILLLIFVICCASSMAQWSTTSDEIGHIASGYSKLKTGDFRLNREHPPLINVINAVPLLFIDLRFDTDSGSWKDGDAHYVGKEFLFRWNRPKLDEILFLSRLAIVFVGILLGILVYLWSLELYGKKAASLALLAYSFCPNIIANSGLSTTDLGFAFFSFAAAYSFWRLIKKHSNKNLIIAGAAFGLLQLSKYSAVYFVPIFMVLIAVLIFLDKGDRRKAAKRYGSYLAAILIITYVMLWAGYIFNTDKAFDAPIREQIFAGKGLPGEVALTISRAIPVPYDYLWGLDYCVKYLNSKPAYLMGEYSLTGWWYYFPIAFLIKTPLAGIILIMLSFAFFKETRSKDIADELFLIIPVAIYLILFMGNTINIGLRHILPIYPFLHVLMSKIANVKIKWAQAMVVMLCIWYVISSLMIWPHYIAYFNELVGGPMNGPKYLSDSNIDWGQDLKGLSAYVKEHNITNITIGYWNSNEPVDIRIRKYNELTCEIKHGWFAVSVYKFIGTHEDSNKCIQWLRDEKPVDNIGYSIYLYYIT